MMQFSVIAQYDHTAERDNELTFFENDVIYLTNRPGSGWWEGIVNGKKGYFPPAYTDAYG